MNNREVIPVVFASDNNYMIPLYLAVKTMLQHLSENSYLDIYILIPEQLDGKYIRLINSIIDDNQCEVHFINMGTQFENTKGLPHVTNATCYRLCLADLLPKYDRCIYLDCDIIVKGDISELYHESMNNYMVAAVKEVSYHLETNRDSLENRRLEVGLKDWRQYFNAGVLLLNLKMIREKNLTQEFIRLANETHFTCLDQDILNLACNNYIKLLPLKYNAMTKYITSEEFGSVISDEEHKAAKEHPIVIHYLTAEKPWYSKKNLMADTWWECLDSVPSSIYSEYFKMFLLESRIKWKIMYFKKFLRENIAKH